MGNKPTNKIQNNNNEDLEDEKSMRIGIGFNKGSARVEGNLLVGCLHKRKRKSTLPLRKNLSITNEEEVGEPPPQNPEEKEEEEEKEGMVSMVTENHFVLEETEE